MLERQKIILSRLSNNKILFRKEIIKSFGYLKSHEIIKLRQWLETIFGQTHREIINDIFEYINTIH
jgi:hypothetical protein